MNYPKRLIEVDLPIARISEHARREKSIRHGHISTLHIWWARRPLAACRAVICAALWPDPEDLAAWLRETEASGNLGTAGPEIRAPRGAKPGEGVVIRPQRFLEEARKRMTDWAMRHYAKASAESHSRLMAIGKNPAVLEDPVELRCVLLDFIADFANWDNSTDPAFLETARALTQAAHEALGGEPGTRPLVVDPFAGGGSIPLEALRVGADAFASDLNPVAVLLNKVVLEYIPKYGQRLADEVRKWGQWIKEQAEKELAQFYPKDPDGATPIAYLWARTIISDAPAQFEHPDDPDSPTLPPVEVPLMRSLWLAKKPGRMRALRWVRDQRGEVQTETRDVTYFVDAKPVVKRVRRPLLEIFEPSRESDVEPGTVARGSATCPVTGYTTKVDSVRAQLRQRRGGAADARLFAVVTTRDREQGRFYRLPTPADQAAFDAAAAELERRERADGTEQSASRCTAGRRSAAASSEVPAGRQAGTENRCSLVPDERLDVRGIRHTWAMIYGLERWGDLFSPRQALALTTLARLAREAGEQARASHNGGLGEAVTTCLAMVVGRVSDRCCSLCRWIPQNENFGYTFGRQAIGMVWDYAESPSLDCWEGAYDDVCDSVEGLRTASTGGHAAAANAAAHPLPDDAAVALVTDPPYYDSVPYAYLSDFFYVWMRRTLDDIHPALFRDEGVPKDAEIVVDRPHQLSQSTKDITFYERELTRAFAEGRRVLAPAGVGAIVFASKTTASWEAILKAAIDAGFVVTGSWPIDTEREARVAAQGQARLASSIHIVVRARENPDGTLRDEVGDWRDVLAELPRRIHAWMPRLAAEGIVGADAIFACLGPALEVFSRHSRVEKTSGEQVTLREYLEEVWAAVAKEALSLLFSDADATGLEPDARLTAMWLWTLGAGRQVVGGRGQVAGGRGHVVGGRGHVGKEEASEDEDDRAGSQGRSPTYHIRSTTYLLEYDAARKIAQGLGAHLDKLPTVVEVKGDQARLLSVAERTKYLFGQVVGGRSNVGRGGRLSGGRQGGRKKKEAQRSLFAELEAAEEATGGGWAVGGAPLGQTVLDRVHQAMILFAAGRGEALKRFLIEEGAGTDGRFWKLADNLAKLYPAGSDERRWVEGVLARKKGLGL